MSYGNQLHLQIDFSLGIFKDLIKTCQTSDVENHYVPVFESRCFLLMI